MPLRGSKVPRCNRYGPIKAEAVAGLRASAPRRGLVGGESGVVHPVGNGQDRARRGEDLPEPSRGRLAHADDGGSVSHGVAQWSARNQTTLLGSCHSGWSKKVMSWTVTTQGTLGPPGHGVVGTVVHLRPAARRGLPPQSRGGPARTKGA